MVSASEKEDGSKRLTVPVPEWLTENLFVEFLRKDYAEFKTIKEFNVVPAMATGENFLTVLLRIKIEIELKDGSFRPASYMVKVLPASKDMQLMVKDFKVFEKERHTYLNYIKEFEQMYRDAGKSITFGAQVYESDALKDEAEVLIMEDLSLRGFKNVKRQNGFDMAHTKAVLTKLAQFHAASAVRYVRRGLYPKVYERSFVPKEDQMEDFRAATAKFMLQCLKDCDADHIASDLEAYQLNLPDLFQEPSQIDDNEFNVLNHGDAWSNNIMFQYDETGKINETYLVDLQMSRFGSPAHDLYYMIISSVCLELKLSHFDYFIYFYYVQLMEHLQLLKYEGKLPTLKDLHIALLTHGDWAYTTTHSVMPFVLYDQCNDVNIDNVMDAGETGQNLRQKLYSNPRYVQHMRQIFPWAYHRGLFGVRH